MANQKQLEVDVASEPISSRLLASVIAGQRPRELPGTLILSQSTTSLARMLRYEDSGITFALESEKALKTLQVDPYSSLESAQAAYHAGKQRELRKGLINGVSPFYMNVVQASLSSTGLKDKAFGLVVVDQAHTTDLPVALAEAKRVVRPGGRIVLTGHMSFRIEPQNADDIACQLINRHVDQFISEELKPYLTAGEQHLLNGFKSAAPMLRDMHYTAPHYDLDATAKWNVKELLRHMQRWPSAAQMHELGGRPVFDFGWFRTVLEQAWGRPGLRRQIRWSVHTLSSIVDAT